MIRRPWFALASSLALAAAIAAASSAPAPPAAGSPAIGTGPPSPAEGTARVVLENDRVRAHRIDYPAGARSDRHAHAHPRVVVVLEGGTLEVRGDDGVARTFRLQSGDVAWRPAETHTLVNTGATTVRLVEIDVLD